MSIFNVVYIYVTSVWLNMQGVIDHIGLKGDMKMTLEQFLKMTSQFTTDPEKQAMNRQTLSSFFDIVDMNGDGAISTEEFKVYFKCMGIDEEYAKPSFDAIDTDKSGLISRDEFIAAGSEFFNGVDQSHGAALFFGPLVD